jgi:hypothetical protein
MPEGKGFVNLSLMAFPGGGGPDVPHPLCSLSPRERVGVRVELVTPLRLSFLSLPLSPWETPRGEGISSLSLWERVG